MRPKQSEPFNAWQHIGDLADRVRRLCPDRRDPERFHIEKSEIEHELRELARVLPGGGRGEGRTRGRPPGRSHGAAITVSGAAVTA